MPLTAEDLMTENVVTIEEGATLGDAAALLAEQHIRHLPVVRDRVLVGMLSDRDLRSLGPGTVDSFESFEALRERLAEPVSSAMRSDVITVGRTTDVVEIVDLLIEEKVGAVPVVDETEGALVGIVSYVDVLRAARDLFAEA